MEWNRPKSRLTPALMVAGILSAILGAYVAGYFLVSDQQPQNPYRHRMFHTKFQSVIHMPAVWIESRVVGFDVHVETKTAGAAVIRRIPKVSGRSAKQFPPVTKPAAGGS